MQNKQLIESVKLLVLGLFHFGGLFDLQGCLGCCMDYHSLMEVRGQPAGVCSCLRSGEASGSVHSPSTLWAQFSSPLLIFN